MKNKVNIIQILAVIITLLGIGCDLPHQAIVWYLGRFDKPFEKLYIEAEAAVAEVGGYDVLTSEADSILRLNNSRKDERNNSFYPSSMDWMERAGAIMQIQKKLAHPHGGLPWIMKSYEDDVLARDADGKWIFVRTIHVPEHITVRFGTHSSYAWMLIFASNSCLTNLPDSAIHMGGTIYISPRNLR